MTRILILTFAFVVQFGAACSEPSSDPNGIQCKQYAKPSPCGASLATRPVEVESHIHVMTDLCKQVKGKPLSGPTVEHGNLATGLEFWAIDESTFRCEGAETLYSGSHGSEVVIYLSAPNGHAKQAFVQGAYGMKIEHAGNYSKIWITLGGQLCGQNGNPTTAELITCERALRWDTSTEKLEFASLSEARVAPYDEQRDEMTRSSIPKRSTDASKPISFQPAVHNGSQMRLSEWENGIVEIAYDVPRPGLSVVKGTLLFRGVVRGKHYSGTAYNFKAGCPPSPYAVSGIRDDRKEIIVLAGTAPRRDLRSCEIEASNRSTQRLIIGTHIDGDE